MIYDASIIGGGPAGVSSALTLRAQVRSVILISADPTDSGLYKAKRIDNYPGMPGVSGPELIAQMRKQLVESDVELVDDVALNAIRGGAGIMVSVGNTFYESRSLILAIGTAIGKLYPNENELLGRGVSYCAVCDGGLYKGRPVVVLALRSDAEEEAEVLRRLGCQVTYIEPAGKTIEFVGVDKLVAVKVDETEIPADCVFVLRSAISPSAFIDGLTIEQGDIITDSEMRTGIPGVYAVGDCRGKPRQIAKAVGDGLLAAYAINAELS